MPDSQTPPRTEIQPPVPTGLAPESPPSDSAADLSEAKGPTRVQIWVHRLLVLSFVFVCAAAGVLLVVLPWTPQWTDNSLLLRYPDLRTIMTHGFFRGLCSGLGMLDIWIGFSEAIHYHEDRLP
ncbi:MAG TPA: hypothetical protein VFA40_20240 [Terriglobales bacterium]|nr:hypothetical protein [Terriglobales bacterium]